MYHSFSLSLVDTIPGGMNAFIAYRPPIANQYVSRQQSIISYFYIAATNSMSSGTAVASGNANAISIAQDKKLLRIRFNNAFVSTSNLDVILNRDSINADTTTTVGYTIVGKYMYI